MANRGMAVAIVAAAALAGCSEGRSESGGPQVSRAYPVAAFDKIEVMGPYDVTVTTGGQPGAQASGRERDIERMVVEVVDGTLRIHPQKSKGLGIRFSRGETVRLNVTAPSLSSAEIAGSGEISVDKVSGDSFESGIAGSGDIRVGQVAVKQLKAAIAGSGHFKAAGRAETAEYEIAGSGEIEAGDVVANAAKVSIAGSGDVQANATGTADVDIGGSGNVRVTGGAKCNVSKAGSGDVQCG